MTNACDAGSSIRFGPATWESQDRGIACSYCGSMTTADAIKALRTPGTHFSGSDWKYAFPHKFYIDIPNPKADEIVEVGGRYGPDINEKTPGAVWKGDGTNEDGSKRGRWYVPEMGKQPKIHRKFYTKHLLDATSEELAEFAAISEACFRIKWVRDEKGLKWCAVPGTQLWGVIDADGKPDHSSMTKFDGPLKEEGN